MVLAVAALTAIPARIAARSPAAQILSSEAAWTNHLTDAPDGGLGDRHLLAEHSFHVPHRMPRANEAITRNSSALVWSRDFRIAGRRTPC
jgi:hypothetical protein